MRPKEQLRMDSGKTYGEQFKLGAGVMVKDPNDPNKEAKGFIQKLSKDKGNVEITLVNTGKRVISKFEDLRPAPIEYTEYYGKQAVSGSSSRYSLHQPRPKQFSQQSRVFTGSNRDSFLMKFHDNGRRESSNTYSGSRHQYGSEARYCVVSDLFPPVPWQRYPEQPLYLPYMLPNAQNVSNSFSGADAATGQVPLEHAVVVQGAPMQAIVENSPTVVYPTLPQPLPLANDGHLTQIASFGTFVTNSTPVQPFGCPTHLPPYPIFSPPMISYPCGYSGPAFVQGPVPQYIPYMFPPGLPTTYGQENHQDANTYANQGGELGSTSVASIESAEKKE